MTPYERSARSARYQALMEDGELREAFDRIEREFTEALVNTFDASQRESMWHAVRVVKKVREHFAQALSAGKVAESAISEIRRAVVR